MWSQNMNLWIDTELHIDHCRGQMRSCSDNGFFKGLACCLIKCLQVRHLLHTRLIEITAIECDSNYGASVMYSFSQQWFTFSNSEVEILTSSLTFTLIKYLPINLSKGHLIAAHKTYRPPGIFSFRLLQIIAWQETYTLTESLCQ